MSFKVENLFFKYSKRGNYILNDLSFSIKKGTINIILGLNGSGKTTLIKTLAGINNDYEGLIFYDNLDFKKTRIHVKSKLISYVSQNLDLAHDVLVKDYLTYGITNLIKFYNVPSKKQIESIYDKAQKWKINHLMTKKLGELSGGQRRLVNICVALLQNAETIILDEPTASLDLNKENEILLILKNINKHEKKTIIFSTHNPNHATLLKSNVILISKGKIVDIGDAKSIINIEKLSNIYGDTLCFKESLQYKW
ncbi:ABC transporter ATP-binding protein [Mycoplasmoides alvi]|uniref:ABC transporter ATP-binding protein n=1 Tax=Mycoplasmoides alvi TaxID=78580 RepID=UPI00051C6DC7|nr:ABC transporter ATP-binding protein [Mycoplasmoides alvi]